MTKKAFLIAVNDYPYPNALKGQVNDRDDLINTLYNYKGFASFTTLTNGNATRSNILSQLTSFVVNSISGDKLAISFCGHGSRLPGPEPDGWSECICPIDVLTNGPIMDYELKSILNQKPAGVKIEVILSCCYSGTGTRSLIQDGKRKKNYKKCQYMPIPNTLFTLVNNKSSVPVEGMNHVLNTACKDSQTAWEGYSGGKYRGLFPLYYCWALRAFPSYNRNQINAKVMQYVMAIIPGQEPQCEGTSSELSQLPFT